MPVTIVSGRLPLLVALLAAGLAPVLQASDASGAALGCTVQGTARADVLRGDAGRDVICGRAGNDLLSGKAGGDVLRGNRGADTLTGGEGRDVLLGGAGNDLIDARDADGSRDVVHCGAGRRDTVWADAGDSIGYGCEAVVRKVPPNRPPTGVKLTPSTVAENEPASTRVGRLMAVDKDPSDRHRFALVGGVGAEDNALFRVDGSNLVTVTPLDFETDSALSIRVRATDTAGATYDKVIRVSVLDVAENANPVAVNDAATVAEGSGASTVEVLANDTDAEGDAFTVDSVTQPANGSVAVTDGGADLTYTPNADYCNDGSSTDDFTYTLTPGGDTATVAVTVTCGPNVPPVAVDDAATVAEGSGASTVEVLANDTDAEGDAFTVDSVTQPANGSVAVTNGGADLTYTPNADYCNDGSSTDDFTYTLTPGGDTATVAVTVTCAPNASPVAVDDAATVAEDSAVSTVAVLANDTDAEGDAFTVDSVTQPANGSVAVTNGGADLTYTPNADYCNDGSSTDDFTYTLTPGGDSATVAVTVTCVNDAPVADDETINGTSSAVGNTALVGDDPADGPPALAGPKKTVTASVLAGDSDMESSALVVTPGTFATNDGGTVTLQADGDFTFVPAASTSCTDTSDFFDYIVSDQSAGTPGTDVGRVTISITGCAWYVSNSASGNSGTSAAPFDTLAQAQAASGVGHAIFVFDGDNTSTGYGAGIDLKADQLLVGEASDLQVGSSLLHTGVPSARPTLTDNNADVVVLASGNTVRGIDVDPQGAGGGVAGGSGDVSGAIDNVRVIDTAVAGTQPGMELDGTSGTWSLNNVAVSTSGATGVRLNSAGTVSGTGINTVQAAGGSGLLVDSTTIGGGNLTFATISSSGSGVGIRANATGSSGRLVVTGTGGTCATGNTAGCSGGTIANTSGGDDAGSTPTGTGILLTGTLNPSFTRMWVHDNSNFAIRGTTVNGFTMSDSVISGVNGTSAAVKDGSVRFEQLTGAVAMTNVAISGGYFTNLMVDNTSGVLNGTFDNVDSGTIDPTGGDDAVQFEGTGTSDMNVAYKNSSITTASGDLFQYIGDGAGGGDLDLTGNTLSNNEPSIVTGGGGVALQAAAKGAATLDVLNNTIRDAKTNAFTMIKSRDATAGTNNLLATVSGNTVGVSGIANSGSAEGDGMEITTFGDGDATFNVTNNVLRQYNSSALQFVAGGGIADSGQLNLNISGNDAAEPGSNPSITLLQGVRIDSGVTAGDAFATCVDFGPNSIASSSDAANKAFRIVAGWSTTVRQPGYAGGPTDSAAFAAYAASRIGGGAVGTATFNNAGTYTGTGTSCP